VQKLLGMRVENTKTIYNSNSVGRNDPCTCSSGLKYKTAVEGNAAKSKKCVVRIYRKN
jgi:uncharacterized protein YecA (UPF0149 family)